MTGDVSANNLQPFCHLVAWINTVFKNNPKLELSRVVHYLLAASRGLNYIRKYRFCIMKTNMNPHAWKPLTSWLPYYLITVQILTILLLISAPEIVANDNVSLKTDMWSVGVIVYVLLSGVSPFYSDNHERACANVTEIRYKFPDDFFADISDEAQDFIEELLIRDQAHRPPAEECLEFPWIRMCDPENSIHVRKKRISLARLAAFNARRRYQYESNNQNTSITTSQLLSPEKKSSLGQRRWHPNS